MHNWGDENVDWEGINNAAQFIARNLVRWGRMGVRDYKEKFGTVRVYVGMGWYSLLSFTHPGYCHYGPYPDWLAKFDIWYGHWLGRLTNWVVMPYHQWLYRQVYRAAIRRWPHLRKEILAGCDWHEILAREIEVTDWGPHETEEDANAEQD